MMEESIRRTDTAERLEQSVLLLQSYFYPCSQHWGNFQTVAVVIVLHCFLSGTRHLSAEEGRANILIIKNEPFW